VADTPARGRYGDDDVLVAAVHHWWRHRRVHRGGPIEIDRVDGPRQPRGRSLLGFGMVVLGSLLGPYAAVWQAITTWRGRLYFPVEWYPFPIALGPVEWYSIMVLGFALFGAGAVLAGGE
jgi:hypothetical protein